MIELVLELMLLFKSWLTNYRLEEITQVLQGVDAHGRDSERRKLTGLSVSSKLPNTTSGVCKVL